MGHTLMRSTHLFQIAMVLAWLMAAGPLLAQDTAHTTDTAHPESVQQAHDAVDQLADHATDAADQTAGHGGGHEERGLTTVKWQEAVYTIVVFGIFFVVLSIFVWPKILASLQVREAKVRGDLQQAEQAAKQASATLAEYKQQLADAQKQAQQIVDESRGAAQQVAAQLKDQAQSEMTQIRQRAEADIDAAKQRAVTEIYEQTAVLATQVAGQILRREINVQDQEALVKESLARLGDAGQN